MANHMFQNAQNPVIHGGTFVVAENIQQTTHVMIVDEDKKKRILNWLNAPDPSNNYTAAREKHCEGTGSWFLDDATFDKWKKEAGPPLILYGMPGCGKTVLCSTIIKAVQDHCSQPGSNSTYAYFFFDGRNSQDEFQLHRNFILSLIKQLTSQHSSIPTSLEQLYGKGNTHPVQREFEHVLQAILDEFADTFIIVDSLDECAEPGLFSKWIIDLMAWESEKLHFIATSRPEQAIHLRGLNYTRFDMEAGAISLDTLRYVEEEIRNDWKLSKVLKKDLDFIGQIVANADGM